ncbi:MAG: hypothetical protein KJ634_10725 [Gammaproteobacteria bacterium]|nr:hypothetical protein [Gammaproteobacteria bacterium]MBU1416086.1 hypothetical protein [Gammaproteobacteria bacterium]
MSAEESGSIAADVEFTATPLEFFGRGLLTSILSALIIPAPWICTWFYRWCVGKLRIKGESEVSFSGEGGQIWFPFMATMVLSFAERGAMEAGYLLLFWLFAAVGCYFTLLIARWFWRNIVLSSGTKLAFVGKYWPLLGWTVLLTVSVVTIIGWAWVAAALIRWGCRQIEGDDFHVEFLGSGWNILWRSFAFLLSCVLIIPIPWTAMWLVKWYLSNVSIQRTAPQG